MFPMLGASVTVMMPPSSVPPSLATRDSEMKLEAQGGGPSQ